jgi:hypothetical protein
VTETLTGDEMIDFLAFSVVTTVAMGASYIGWHALDEKLRRHYQSECEQCR